MCLAQRPQRSDASEARTRVPSVSSQIKGLKTDIDVYMFPKLSKEMPIKD